MEFTYLTKEKKEFVGHIDNEKGLADFKITAIYVGKKFLVLGQQGLSIIPFDNPHRLVIIHLKEFQFPIPKLSSLHKFFLIHQIKTK
jgi:hypothetical protein